MASQPSAASEQDAIELPKDANTIIAILKDMGITDYEPKVINQLLEFTYRYVTDVLEDSKVYAGHAGRANVNLDDVKLAVQTQLDHSFTGPPPRDFLVDLARQKNNIALPSLKNFSGTRLPPDRYCLSSVNYRLKQGPEKSASSSRKAGTVRKTASSTISSTTTPKQQFVNPQIIMPSSAPKRKWLDDDDYDT